VFQIVFHIIKNFLGRLFVDTVLHQPSLENLFTDSQIISCSLFLSAFTLIYRLQSQIMIILL